MKVKKPQLLGTVILTHEDRHLLGVNQAALRERFPAASVRTYQREVRADRLTFRVHVIVARAKA